MSSTLSGSTQKRSDGCLAFADEPRRVLSQERVSLLAMKIGIVVTGIGWLPVRTALSVFP